MNAIIEQARSLDGYQDSSELLQRRDQDWVLDRAGIEPRSLLDLGCGIGSLLLGGARRWPGLQRLWGIERSPLRLEQARAQLRGAGVEARLLEGDLLDLPPLAERFELISMTAVLHWLYPDEERLFRWVARHLEAQGVFLFTSHHPFAEDGLGGEDDLVAQALVEMGLAASERVAALYAEAGLLPMGTRTRGREALRERVERHFRVDSIVSRPAVLRVADSAEYQRFPAAPFGTYFAPLVPATRLEEFFVRLGRIAERRMQADGQVSEIPVSVWRCRAREGEA
ncbi:class I SAM-dependent methyltransferase [Pseudomonas aeruginosa]|nr:class I SAM-dependent methyltransferase [Pseudomonas aeruginosa]